MFLGINFGAYVLLAADTRTTYPNGSVANDDSEKIQKTTIGLIAGAGSFDLINHLVNNRLQKKEVTDINRIYSIIKEERLRCRNKRDVEITKWICSYPTIDNGNRELTLCIIPPTVGDGLEPYREKDLTKGYGQYYLKECKVIMPNEATEEDGQYFKKSLKSEIALCLSKPFETPFHALECHSRKIVRLIQRLSLQIQPKFPSISPHCQIGVHTLRGQNIYISPILKATDVASKDKLSFFCNEIMRLESQ